MNLLQGELVGLDVEVAGKKGRVVDETKHLLLIEDEGGRTIKMPKAQHTFRFGRVEVEGKKLVGRPEERVKRKR